MTNLEKENLLLMELFSHMMVYVDLILEKTTQIAIAGEITLAKQHISEAIFIASSQLYTKH